MANGEVNLLSDTKAFSSLFLRLLTTAEKLFQICLLLTLLYFSWYTNFLLVNLSKVVHPLLK